VETKIVTPVGSEKRFPLEGNIIAASNRDLEKRVEEGKFRQDLFYRLNVVQHYLPPLRERREDIPLLAEYFLGRFAAETKSSPKRLSKGALRALQAYDYPGNTRELKNLMERVNIYCEGSVIETSDLRSLMPSVPTDKGLLLREAVAAFERDYIRAAIARHQGNIAAAARELGLERSHLYKKLKKLEEAE
jgi:DNA-binding NtrC family response regulator